MIDSKTNLINGEPIVASVIYWATDSATQKTAVRSAGVITQADGGLNGYVVRGGDASYATGVMDRRPTDVEFVAAVVRNTYGVPHRFANGGAWL